MIELNNFLLFSGVQSKDRNLCELQFQLQLFS